MVIVKVGKVIILNSHSVHPWFIWINESKFMTLCDLIKMATNMVDATAEFLGEYRNSNEDR